MAVNTAESGVGFTEVEWRVAEAIFNNSPCTTGANSWKDVCEGNQFGYAHPWRRDECLKAARAAIRAMRDPSVSMVSRGVDFWRNATGPEEDVTDIWQAMIDAATAPIKEQHPGASTEGSQSP